VSKSAPGFAGAAAAATARVRLFLDALPSVAIAPRAPGKVRCASHSSAQGEMATSAHRDGPFCAQRWPLLRTNHAPWHAAPAPTAAALTAWRGAQLDPAAAHVLVAELGAWAGAREIDWSTTVPPPPSY
jgi:hypothetical protein